MSVDSNGTSTSGETTGLVTGKDGMRGLLGGLEPSPELLAIAMGAQTRMSACPPVRHHVHVTVHADA